MEFLSKQELRDQKRRMRAEARSGESQRARMSSILWSVFFVALLLALIGYVMWQIFRPLVGTKVPLLERSHVPETEHPTYNSNPPTSGAHYVKTEDWGISDKPLVIERLVHNMEHGGIVIFYNCERMKASCEESVKQLKEITERLRKKDPKVVLSPRQELEAPIVLAAWGWLDTMEVLDEERILRFFRDHINQGPERVLM